MSQRASRSNSCSLTTAAANTTSTTSTVNSSSTSSSITSGTSTYNETDSDSDRNGDGNKLGTGRKLLQLSPLLRTVEVQLLPNSSAGNTLDVELVTCINEGEDIFIALLNASGK